MLRLTRIYMVPVVLVLMALALAGCQPVADARTEFCQTLHDVGNSAVELKNAKVDQPVDQVKATVDGLQQKKKNLDRLAKLTPIPALDKLAAAIDGATQAVSGAVGNTLGPVVQKVNVAGDTLQQTYTELNDAVCVAK
jgi:hypothetical protein